MNILYLSWTENSASDMIETLQQLGHNVCAQLHELSFYFSDALIPSLQQVFASQSFDCIFTFNFIPPVSNVAEAIQIPYLCWVYDCPHVTLYSNSLRNRCNYIFLFDRKMQQDALLHGALHAYHLPLAINADRLASHLSLSGSRDTFFPTTYRHEVSFVGSLYEKTTFEHLKNVPPHLKGYLDGIIAAQKQVWGADVISAALSPDHVNEIYQALPFTRSAGEFITPKDVYTGVIQKQVTSEERISLLNAITNVAPVALYSASDTSLCPKAAPMGIVSYTAEMPDIFHTTKINLNITLRSITSGIPLRAIDILGCGGFLLSNYQPELCEYFTPDVDFVYFEDPDDLAEKVTYYLSHEKEREDIAYHATRRSRRIFPIPFRYPACLNFLPPLSENLQKLHSSPVPGMLPCRFFSSMFRHLQPALLICEQRRNLLRQLIHIIQMINQHITIIITSAQICGVIRDQYRSRQHNICHSLCKSALMP